MPTGWTIRPFPLHHPVEIDFNTIHPYLTHVSETNFRCMHIFHMQYFSTISKKSIAVECAQSIKTIFELVFYPVGIDFQLSTVRLGELNCLYFQMSHQGVRERLGDYVDHIGRLREFECHNSNFKTLVKSDNLP